MQQEIKMLKIFSELQQKSEVVESSLTTAAKINIEIRIEAGSEKIARQYAALCNIDLRHAIWHQNKDSGGRLYVSVIILPPMLPAA